MMNRRKFLLTSASIAALGILPAASAFATPEAAGKLANDFIKGAAIEEGGIDLELPEIAENGNTVPLSVFVDSPMTKDNYVKSIMLLSEGNPNPEVATFHFTPISGEASASTRIRLAGTQNIIAIAALSDGSFKRVSKTVKVTIGGCGG